MALCFSVAGLCQVSQSRPEFCGLAGQVVPLPPGIQTTTNRDTHALELTARSGVPAIRLPLWDGRIDQICPLSEDGLVIFGNDGTSINIVDIAQGTLVDTFLSYDPVLSPDKRWIIFRKFLPRNTELPASDEYLLYDLSKSPAQNRPTGVYTHRPGDWDIGLDVDVGRAAYPAGWKNESGDNIGVPTEQRHGLTSPFFWSPDSGAIVFSDLGSHGSSLVRISIEETGVTKASVYPLPVAKGCNVDQAGQYTFVRRIEFGPREASDQLLFADVETTGCSTRSLQLHSAEFRPAKAESRVATGPTKLPRPAKERPAQ